MLVSAARWIARRATPAIATKESKDSRKAETVQIESHLEMGER